MGKLGFIVALALGLNGAQADERLTALEQRWVAGAAPVLTYARKIGLPLDVVVQPTDQPGRAPLAMGFVDGRCKLVLSMRGNPAAERSLDGVADDLVAPVIEAVAAHELGHCWRYVQGAWKRWPAGFADVELGAGHREGRELREMRETRREEGFADLVGLAWAFNRHPERYARVHAWFVRVRDDVDGSHHDTSAWIERVRDPAAFADGDTPFDQVLSLWRQGIAPTD